MAGRDVYLVGSVPMADAAQVFEAVSAALGRRIKRIPDGETGERGDWITWLEPVFAQSPALEKSGDIFRLHATAPRGNATGSSPAARRRTCISTICTTPISQKPPTRCSSG